MLCRISSLGRTTCRNEPFREAARRSVSEMAVKSRNSSDGRLYSTYNLRTRARKNPSPNSTWLVTSCLDATRHVRRVETSVERVELCLFVSCRVCRAVLFDKLDTAKMYGLDTSNVSCRVVSRRDEPSGIWATQSVGTRDAGVATCQFVTDSSER